MLTPARIEEIRHAAEELREVKGRATEGPWAAAELDRRCVVGADGLVVADIRSWRDAEDGPFLVAARNTPLEAMALELIAEIERMRPVVNEIVALWREGYDGQLLGERVEPLMSALANYEYGVKL